MLDQELIRPHSYESLERKNFSGTKQGSFTGAKRFDYQGNNVTRTLNYTTINKQTSNMIASTTDISADDIMRRRGSNMKNFIPQRGSPDFGRRQQYYSIIDAPIDPPVDRNAEVASAAVNSTTCKSTSDNQRARSKSPYSCDSQMR